MSGQKAATGEAGRNNRTHLIRSHQDGEAVTSTRQTCLGRSHCVVLGQRLVMALGKWARCTGIGPTRADEGKSVQSSVAIARGQEVLVQSIPDDRSQRLVLRIGLLFDQGVGRLVQLYLCSDHAADLRRCCLQHTTMLKRTILEPAESGVVCKRATTYILTRSEVPAGPSDLIYQDRVILRLPSPR